mmetsp:Transcript_21246/g.30059  ORF Transcript_21246/g.30059 Transcript_21246/m.30059 type:complete len:469 (+) Transcript_21246:79-1485(+)
MSNRRATEAMNNKMMYPVKEEHLEETASERSSLSPPVSRSSSVAELEKAIEGSSSPLSSSSLSASTTSTIKRTGASFKDRSRIPPSLYLAGTLVCSLLFFTEIALQPLDVLKSLQSSIGTSSTTLATKWIELQETLKAIASGEILAMWDYAYAAISIALVCPLFYVLIGAPLRAGMWTGKRAKRHKVHRYMGLVFMMQYALAWVEFITNYEAAKDSYLPLTVALNGLIQAVSAYLSFKVLPELDDAGYYSDKAVLSRKFVHENIFFQLMTTFGSLYYHDGCRAALKSSIPGQIIEYVVIFWPYILLRTWFPVTRFKNAGSSKLGRTQSYERFYSIGTKMIKIFYLWAKYFLGFHINFLVFLGFPTSNDMKFIRGMFLLNAGTVSISVFLHTLRFKKVLPPRLTFSLYILQIYATFYALPYAYKVFMSHPKLSAVTFSGFLANLTRDRRLHCVWCACTMFLLGFTSIEW